MQGKYLWKNCRNHYRYSKYIHTRISMSSNMNENKIKLAGERFLIQCFVDRYAVNQL